MKKIRKRLRMWEVHDTGWNLWETMVHGNVVRTTLMDHTVGRDRNGNTRGHYIFEDEVIGTLLPRLRKVGINYKKSK